MKLHLNPPYFRAVLNGVEKRTGKRRDILEKDYYITLILEELSQQGGIVACLFQGRNRSIQGP